MQSAVHTLTGRRARVSAFGHVELTLALPRDVKRNVVHGPRRGVRAAVAHGVVQTLANHLRVCGLAQRGLRGVEGRRAALVRCRASGTLPCVVAHARAVGAMPVLTTTAHVGNGTCGQESSERARNAIGTHATPLHSGSVHVCWLPHVHEVMTPPVVFASMPPPLGQQ